MYTADPSANIFNGKIYICLSHDIDAGIPENDNGDHFDMLDYHVFSMDDIDGPVNDHVVLSTLKIFPERDDNCGHPIVLTKTANTIFIFP